MSSGDLLISFYINDSRGYINSKEVIVTLDKTPPIITLSVTPDPSNGITIIQAFNTTEIIAGSLLKLFKLAWLLFYENGNMYCWWF